MLAFQIGGYRVGIRKSGWIRIRATGRSVVAGRSFRRYFTYSASQSKNVLYQNWLFCASTPSVLHPERPGVWKDACRCSALKIPAIVCTARENLFRLQSPASASCIFQALRRTSPAPTSITFWIRPRCACMSCSSNHTLLSRTSPLCRIRCVAYDCFEPPVVRRNPSAM